MQLPDPAEWEPRLENIWEPPKPDYALEHLMEAIDGDDSPASYLSASLFYREMLEYGARWHGCSWSTHILLSGPPAGNSDGPEQWEWRMKTPAIWIPQVQRTNNKISVRFYTYSGLGGDTIYRNVDTYELGYRMKINVCKIACGPSGFFF